MCLGSTPVKSLNIRKLDVDTNDATVTASEMQSGTTAYAKGKKVTGTGKSFVFASYGLAETNDPISVPTMVNVVGISSLLYPVQLQIALSDMKDNDFSAEYQIATDVINGASYPITARVSDNNLVLSCEQTSALQVFYGKDEHV